MRLRCGNFRRLACIAIGMLAVQTAPAQATVVRFTTSLGNIDVRLYDGATPLHAANFLSYSTSNRYDGTFIHRAPQDFVVQGGGFTLTPPNTVNAVVADAPVQNEPGISNLRGTLALAKTDAGPSSGTNQWFFNIGDNSANLNFQNGGFTVFGRIVGNGLTVIDAINALPTQDLDGSGQTFNEVPVRALAGALTDRLVFINTVTTLNLPAGDYNRDGKVDSADLTLWKADYGSTTKAEADGNGNGRVDGEDFLLWQRTLGQNFGSPGVSAVPEPSAGTLALVAAFAVLRRRRRK
jgi:MYXO-CTERM domain-containing protein